MNQTAAPNERVTDHKTVDLRTIAHLCVEGLTSLGIQSLFCLPGVQNDPFFDALVDAPHIRPITTRHEQGAAYMAMGASQVTGRPAAFAVVPGPGLLNAGAALTSAYWAGGRTLAVVGAIADFQRGRNIGVLHELPDSSAVIAQLTKHQTYLDDGGQATRKLQRVLDTLLSGQPRPVAVEVPVDCWPQAVDGHLTPPVAVMPEADAESVERAARILARSERPLIVVGGGAHEASVEVRQLAERLQAPVFTRRQGHGVIDSRHPLWCPLTVGRELWRDVDVVVGIGTRMEFPLNHWGIDEDLTIIQINVDETELDRHNLGTIGLHGDAGPTVIALIEALGSSVGARPDRTVEVAERRAEFQRQAAFLEPQRAYLEVIRRVLPDSGVIVEDVTQLGFAAHLLFEFRHPRSFLTTGPAGTLGAGVAHAIGAQAAVPDRPVLGLVGDGGFLFTAAELATAVQYEIPVTIVLHDNGGYGNVRTIQRERFGADRTIASTLRNPDFVALVKSFGAWAEEVDTPDGLQSSLARAIVHPGPSVVVLKTGDVPSPWPLMIMGRVRGRSPRRWRSMPGATADD
ncbi:MAG: thiamine pyrophosphate-binding protein [Acidimicrobiia bacterium]|nr:thiamine pyrophosphate-binding protein [Acidimicrobiia bacterium]